APMQDPNNPNFVYQRFQRGIMHYDATTGVTRGILLADYLKSILTGQGLPDDLRQQARGTRLYAQYSPGAPLWLARPADLPGTDLSWAFEQGCPRGDQPVGSTSDRLPTLTCASASSRSNVGLLVSRRTHQEPSGRTNSTSSQNGLSTSRSRLSALAR